MSYLNAPDKCLCGRSINLLEVAGAFNGGYIGRFDYKCKCGILWKGYADNHRDNWVWAYDDSNVSPFSQPTIVQSPKCSKCGDFINIISWSGKTNSWSAKCDYCGTVHLKSGCSKWIVNPSFFKEEKKVAELNNGYYVYNVTKKTSPMVRHGQHHDAVEEAKRLAAMNPGQSFEVLAITCACKKEDVKVEYTEDGCDVLKGHLPF
jgi:hypothetical protein